MGFALIFYDFMEFLEVLILLASVSFFLRLMVTKKVTNFSTLVCPGYS